MVRVSWCLCFVSILCGLHLVIRGATKPSETWQHLFRASSFLASNLPFRSCHPFATLKTENKADEHFLLVQEIDIDSTTCRQVVPKGTSPVSGHPTATSCATCTSFWPGNSASHRAPVKRCQEKMPRVCTRYTAVLDGRKDYRACRADMA